MTLGKWLKLLSLSFLTGSVQSLSHALLLVTPKTAAHQVSLSITNTHSLLKLMSIESVMPFNHLSLCRLLLILPSIFPSIGVFSSESALHSRWPNHWGFSFSISPSNEYSALISFGKDWLDLFAVQGTLKSPLPTPQFKHTNPSALSFLIIQFSHPYMVTGKNIALTRQTFVGKVMSLFFNKLFRFVIAFLQRRKCLFIAKFRHKLRKIGKNTRPFRYGLDQIPYDYAVRVMNRLKGLDERQRA